MSSLDRKVVAKTEQYEAAYFGAKHGLAPGDARAILQRAGVSRKKADALAEGTKKQR